MALILIVSHAGRLTPLWTTPLSAHFPRRRQYAGSKTRSNCYTANPILSPLLCHGTSLPAVDHILSSSTKHATRTQISFPEVCQIWIVRALRLLHERRVDHPCKGEELLASDMVECSLQLPFQDCLRSWLKTSVLEHRSTRCLDALKSGASLLTLREFSRCSCSVSLARIPLHDVGFR